MATVLVTAPPTPSLPATANHRILDILNQSTTVSIPQLKQIHAHILRTSPPPDQSFDTLFLLGKLLHFSSLKDVTYTSQLFRQIPNPNIFIFNTLIRAYAHSKHHKHLAFPLFSELVENESLRPDNYTFPSVLKACAYLFASREGQQAHAYALKRGFGSDVYVNNSLIHFYASCGCSKSARKVFDKMTDRTHVSWGAIIDALVQLGEFEESLTRFREMSEWFEPDGYTLQSAIDACAGLGALSMGMWAHAYVLRKGGIGPSFDVLIQNSLVDMYSECGSLRMALQVFEGMSTRIVNSWNAVILGLAAHGESERVFEYFNQMLNEGNVRPNSITFVGVLSACKYRGLVDKGRKYFDMMVKQYNIKPVLQHYGCLTDLLARSGNIDEALEVVSNMPMKPDSAIWRSLVDSSCKNCEGLELSQEIAKQIMAAEGNATSGDYVLLSKVYASAHKWDKAGLVRKLMSDKGINKEPGCSTIELDGIVHEFFAGDTTHPHTKEIYQFLNVIEERLKLAGYVPDCSEATLVDESNDGKANTLRLHSEKLAIAFGLMNSKPGATIRVFKNLRICSDCHKFTELVSKVFDVEIIMRDRLRFHHFNGGVCSCKNFW